MNTKDHHKHLTYLLLIIFFLWLTIITILFVPCSYCSSSLPTNKSHPNFLYLRNSTLVTLQQVGSNIYQKNCSGVWIDTYHFVTAAHCLEEGWVTYQTFSNYSVESGGVYPWGYTGLVLKRDQVRDLALVLAYGGWHTSVNVNISLVSTGDKVWAVGHPNGYGYSVVDGVVSGSREVVREAGVKYHLWQVDSNIGPGNSGGGLYDNSGNLLGICSFINLGATRFAFFVAGDEVFDFVK